MSEEIESFPMGATLHVGTKGYTHAHWMPIEKKWNGPRTENFYDTKKDDDLIDTYILYLDSLELKLPKSKEKMIYYAENFPECTIISFWVSYTTKLKNFLEWWKVSKEILDEIKNQLGVLTIEFPTSFKCTRSNIEKIKEMKKIIEGDYNIVCEFKSKTWYDLELYPNAKKNIFRNNWVMATVNIGKQYDKHHFGDVKDGTSEGIYSDTNDFMYFKMNGSKGIGLGTYGAELLELEILKRVDSKMETRTRPLTVFVYFSNVDSWEPYSKRATNSYGVMEVNTLYPLAQYGVTDSRVMTPSAIFDAVLLKQLL